MRQIHSFANKIRRGAFIPSLVKSILIWKSSSVVDVLFGIVTPSWQNNLYKTGFLLEWNGAWRKASWRTIRNQAWRETEHPRYMLGRLMRSWRLRRMILTSQVFEDVLGSGPDARYVYSSSLLWHKLIGSTIDPVVPLLLLKARLDVYACARRGRIEESP